MIGDRFVVAWQVDAHDLLAIYGTDGTREREVGLPGLGRVAVSGRRRDAEFFYSFASFTAPDTIYRCDPVTGASTVFRRPKLPFDPAAYETVQVFYPSKDGTRIPLFITSLKGAPRDGQNPTLLTGYGGFNISMLPSFSPATIAWLELGGVSATACLRGGGEYGKDWHDAGRLARKQNVFDDFIAAAEYLIAERYTSTPKLAIAGASNGGLLIGAVLNQRPDLFGAALPAVGVMDMLRFHLFTIGWAWKSDYGSSETKEGFETLIKYSPLQNIRPGTKYPAVLITTGDHDDRVVPAHSFKYAATLQRAQAGDAPVLIRIETRAGHGAGKPTHKIIEETADRYAFLVRNLGMKLKPAP
jgi:prolyl oligopeptidase